MEEKTLKEKVDYTYQKVRAEEESEESKTNNRVGTSTGFVIGLISGFIIFFISLFLWTFWYAVAAGIGSMLVLTLVISRMKWQPWIPFSAKVGKKKARNNFVIVAKVGDNKAFSFERQQIKEGTILVDGIPRPVTAENIILYKGKTPMVFALNYCIPLLNFNEHYTTALSTGNGTKAWKLLISRIKSEALLPDKKGISGMVIVLIVIAIGAGAYFAVKGGWF